MHASFGITYKHTGNKFQRSFGGNKVSSPPPGKWTQGPLQVWEGYPSLWNPVVEKSGVCKGRGLVVLYAVPSALKVKLPGNKPLSMDEGVPKAINLYPVENLNKIDERLKAGVKNDLRSWVTFPLMKLPVYTSGYSSGTLTIQLAEGSGLSAELSPYDEMHYLRCERFQIMHGELYSESLEVSWKNLQPRVEGILEMWFEWTPSKRLLEVWVLAAGGGAAFGRSTKPDSWPAEAPWRSEFERHELVVVQASWLLRNL